MEKIERRRYKRCNEDTKIAYSFFNQTKTHPAVAKNYSRFGMYFESDIPLSPGTTIVIRYMGCDADNRDGNSLEGKSAAYYCKDIKLVSEACREIKTLVLAEVKRCENCEDLDGEPYGIGVHYIRSSI